MKISKISSTRLCSAAVMAMIAGTAAQVLAQGQPPASYSLAGVVRDFSPTNPDFSSAALTGAAYSTGNIAPTINGAEPAYIGGGKKVLTPALDILGRPISPGVAVVAPLHSFTINNGKVTSAQPMAVRLRVIGAAIVLDGINAGVTVRCRNGGAFVPAFGNFDQGYSGNVNDNNNPRSAVLDTLVKPGDALTVDARSWRLTTTSQPTKNSSWTKHMEVFSTNGGQQVKALRNGDLAPVVVGFQGQVSAKAMLLPYLNAAKTHVVLQPHQVIFLFELGTTSLTSLAFDMQDVVVLADLANDPGAFSGPPPAAPACGAVADAPAVLGAADTGGISSNESFSRWFKSVPDENTSMRLDIALTKGTDGFYGYSTTDFHPIDDDLYGNQGGAHNRGFTFGIDSYVTYKQCTGQFFEYGGDLEAWVFVNGKLVLDMGGAPNNARQVLNLDRLGLTDGSDARVQIFFAQRSPDKARFAVKTNMIMSTPTMSVPALSDPVD